MHPRRHTKGHEERLYQSLNLCLLVYLRDHSVDLFDGTINHPTSKSCGANGPIRIPTAASPRDHAPALPDLAAGARQLLRLRAAATRVVGGATRVSGCGADWHA